MRIAEPQHDIYRVVERAWTDTLPRTPFDPEQSWEDAGADSLKSLHLVMRLETALGRKVSFDFITREMTAADLAKRLDGEVERRSPTTSPTVQTVFFVPGLYGYDTTQADFRRSLQGSVELAVLELPDVEVPANVLVDMAATGRFIADQIMLRAPEGDIYLAGYSYGGSVAYEAALYLQSCGREVRFIAILDTYLNPGIDGFAPEEQVAFAAENTAVASQAGEGIGFGRRLLPRRGEGLLAYYDRTLFAMQMRLGLIEAARRTLLRTRHRVSPDLLVNRRKFVLGMCRRQAIEGWRPEPSSIPSLVVSSDEGVRHNLAARWKRIAPPMWTLRLPGGHMDIFRQPALTLLKPAFIDAVAQAKSAER